MPEDNENPYPSYDDIMDGKPEEIGALGTELGRFVATIWGDKHRAYNEGCEYGQRNPSPETIQSIRQKVLEDVKTELEKPMRLIVKFSPERDPEQRVFRCGLEEQWQEVWHNLREGGD